MYTEFIQVVQCLPANKHGLSRNLSTPELREFWLAAARARAIVASWPAWKRNVRIGVTHD